MKHYDITIIGGGVAGITLACQLQNYHKVLLVNEQTLNAAYEDKYLMSLSQANVDILFSTRCRNTIKTENGYIMVLDKESKNIQISTNKFIREFEINLGKN